MRRFFTFIIWGALTFAGGYVVWEGGCSVWKGYVSSGWPKTVGTIEQSHASSSKPIIVYTYSVDGRSYVGSEYDTSWLWRLTSSSQIVIDHPLGSQQPVYFSPSNPAESLLLTGVHPGSFQGVIIGTLMLSVGFLFCTTAYLAPKYGRISPGGRSYNFDNSSPVALIIALGILAIATQGILIWLLVR
jgi:hypothetical protein